MMSITSAIKQKALELGFDLVGIANARPVGKSHVNRLKNWLLAGYAGDMQYMHRNFEKRINPSELLKNARSVVCIGLNYRPSETSSQTENTQKAGVANFALYEDYHDFIKKNLQSLAFFIHDSAKNSQKFKICVDSAPLLERALAEKAGLGFIGKNRMLINQELGCQLLLGEIITPVKLTPDDPVDNLCNNCDNCINACQTNALAPDGSLDASKCVSYLTIELKDEIPAGFSGKTGNSIFGCDRCIKACPFEKAAKGKTCKNTEFKFHPERQELLFKEILGWDRKKFNKVFGDSSATRTGLDKIKSNVRTCLRNLKDQQFFAQKGLKMLSKATPGKVRNRT